MYRLGTRKQNNGAGRADCNFCRLSPYSLLTHLNPTRSDEKKKKKQLEKAHVVPEKPNESICPRSCNFQLVAVFEKSALVVYGGESCSLVHLFTTPPCCTVQESWDVGTLGRPLPQSCRCQRATGRGIGRVDCLLERMKR